MVSGTDGFGKVQSGLGVQKPKYQLLEPLSREEREALKADIAKRGVLIPAEEDESGHTLDGHNRKEIAAELGIPCPTIVRRFASEQEKREHVLKINLARRHLDPLRWGKAFALLLEERGVRTGSGARNDQTSATVAEVAAELGVPERTARRRLASAKAFDALPESVKLSVGSGETKLKDAVGKQKKIEAASAEPPVDRPEVESGDGVQGEVKPGPEWYGPMVEKAARLIRLGREFAAELDAYLRCRGGELLNRPTVTNRGKGFGSRRVTVRESKATRIVEQKGHDDLFAIVELIELARPKSLCAACQGVPDKTANCRACRGLGWRPADWSVFGDRDEQQVMECGPNRAPWEEDAPVAGPAA